MYTIIFFVDDEDMNDFDTREDAHQPANN